MENFGVISELNWNFPDESEFTMAQLLGSFPEMNGQDQETSLGINSMFWSEFDQGAGGDNMFDNVSSCWPSSSNTSASSYFFPPPESENYELNYPNANSNPMNYQIEDYICLKDDENEVKENKTNNNPSEADALLDHKAKRRFPELGIDDKDDGIPTESPKKKVRGSSQVENNIKSTRSKKGQKNSGSGEEAMCNVSSSSEDELNASQELNEGTSSSGKGKTRAGRGSATDPQSLYARKRRERINERLKILQNLVPNGTKVDISTMLDEAVQYVKFLQLQIKLLSSDDLWMYAPLAYNGMDIGLDMKLTLPKP